MANESDNSSVSSDELGLRLSCSSSSFDDISDTENELANGQHDQCLGLQPYQYEPVADVGLGLDVEEQPRQDDDVDVDRLGVAIEEWCSCHSCVTMPTAQECKCCKEIDEVAAKTQSAGDGNIQCITDHPGFATVCLDVFVLETAYYEYRQRYGHLQEEDIHMRYRYTAYRQLVRWCWGYVGRRNRLILPACAVTKIRNKFQSPQYVGFQYPPLN